MLGYSKVSQKNSSVRLVLEIRSVEFPTPLIYSHYTAVSLYLHLYYQSFFKRTPWFPFTLFNLAEHQRARG